MPAVMGILDLSMAQTGTPVMIVVVPIPMRATIMNLQLLIMNHVPISSNPVKLARMA